MRMFWCCHRLITFLIETYSHCLDFAHFFFTLSPLNNNLQRFDDIFGWTYEHWFQTYSMYYLYPLPRPCDVNYVGIRCRFYIGRHFLARYLKVRCCIDCNLPSKGALTEFAAQKNTFPLEHIICMFLLQKFGFNKRVNRFSLPMTEK